MQLPTEGDDLRELLDASFLDFVIIFGRKYALGKRYDRLANNYCYAHLILSNALFSYKGYCEYYPDAVSYYTKYMSAACCAVLIIWFMISVYIERKKIPSETPVLELREKLDRRLDALQTVTILVGLIIFLLTEMVYKCWLNWDDFYMNMWWKWKNDFFNI